MSLLCRAILAVLLALQPYQLDRDEPPESRRARLVTIALELDHAVQQVDAAQRLDLAAALLSIGWLESRFARYVGEGRCQDGPKGARCDPDRRGVPQSRTYWQVKRVTCPQAWREPPGSRAELRAALRCAQGLWRMSYRRCRRDNPHGPEAGAFAGYRSIDCTWRGGVRRVATLRSFQRKLRESLTSERSRRRNGTDKVLVDRYVAAE